MCVITQQESAARPVSAARSAAAGAVALALAGLSAPPPAAAAALCQRADLPTLLVDDLSMPARAWCVAPPLSGRKLRDRAHDVSAVACVSDTLCVAASDETRFVEVVRLDRDGYRIVPLRFVYLADTPVTRKGNDRKDPPEFDIEAAAVIGERVVAIGSHGRSRRGGPAPERELLAAFQLNESRLAAWPRARRRDDDERKRADGVAPVAPAEDSGAGSMIAALIAALEPDGDGPLTRSRDRCTQDNGFGIEGLAFTGAHVAVGLRGPLDDGRAIVLSADRDAFMAGRIERARRHELDLAGLSGIRALLPLGPGMLVLAGRSQAEPVRKGPCAGIAQGPQVEPALHYWGGPDDPATLRLVGRFSAKRHKPEAMTLLSADPDRKEIELLVFFDGPRDGEPTSYRIPFEP